MDETIKTHESFGLIGISRYEGGHHLLFGSSIQHRNGISLTIREADLRRDLSRDWYFGGKILVKVKMSQSQFAELITTPNVGDGVPCTIEYAEGTVKEHPPFESKAQQFRDEFTAHAKKVSDDGTLYMKEAVEILKTKTTISKKDREIILGALSMLTQEIKSNLPFLQSQFHEQMNKTIVEAKSEIEAFVEHKIRSVGLEGIKEQIPQLTE